MAGWQGQQAAAVHNWNLDWMRGGFLPFFVRPSFAVGWTVGRVHVVGSLTLLDRAHVRSCSDPESGVTGEVSSGMHTRLMRGGRETVEIRHIIVLENSIRSVEGPNLLY